MIDGVMLLWFTLTAMSVLFVAVDIRTTPESPVLKWGFVLLTAYTGPVGAFLYVLGCREPLPGLHERYVTVRWRQVLGSTMHCVAGDGVGILAGAVIAAVSALSGFTDIALEYVLGFGFGWSIFQALFMRDMAGGSYTQSLTGTFFPELLSMNCLMAGMVPVMTVVMAHSPDSHRVTSPEFWFVMSMALLVGFVTAYPMNWWLVANHLKHGMMTVRASSVHDFEQAHEHMEASRASSEGAAASRRGREGTMHGDAKTGSRGNLAWMTVVSFVVFALGLGIAAVFGGI